MNGPSSTSSGVERPPGLDSAVVIVSGLPRSGTSMMMRMLESGGIPMLVDNLRAADEDNPEGYYEFEPVKKTKEAPAWLEQARGRAVKMVYRLLYDLPSGYTYYVIFMQRHLDEIVASQNVMLKRHGRSSEAVNDQVVKDLFARELAKVERWLASQPDFHVLDVDYNQMLRDAAPQIRAIQEFLGVSLDTAAMAAVVEPRLYRNRR